MGGQALSCNNCSGHADPSTATELRSEDEPEVRVTLCKSCLPNVALWYVKDPHDKATLKSVLEASKGELWRSPHGWFVTRKIRR